MTFSCTEIIEHLYLEPLPLEGGYFRRTYETAETIDLAKGYIQPVGSGIYFLLTPDSFSAFHWLIEDEVYHFYLGDPVELYELSPDEALRRTILGQDLEFGQQVQHTVFKNRWHGGKGSQHWTRRVFSDTWTSPSC